MSDNESSVTLNCSGCLTDHSIKNGVICPTCKSFYCAECQELIICVECGDEGTEYCFECIIDHSRKCDECEHFVCNSHWKQHSQKHAKEKLEMELFSK